MTATSATRVPAATSPENNSRINRRTAESVRHYAENPQEISRRLEELDREWDIERALETTAASLAFTGSVMAMRRKSWLLLPAIVTGFLFQHAVQGWCPPLPILRRLGFRTRREIDEERFALKALRGDFGPIGPGAGDSTDTMAAHALQAARL